MYIERDREYPKPEEELRMRRLVRNVLILSLD